MQMLESLEDMYRIRLWSKAQFLSSESILYNKLLVCICC